MQPHTDQITRPTQPRPLQALRSLRSRKQVEKRVDNLSNQLESIRGILDRIDQSSTDKTVRGGAACVPAASSGRLDSCRTGLPLLCLQVVQAYQAGVAALKLSLKDVTLESAENLVDQIQEVWRPLETQRRHSLPFHHR